MTELNLEDPIQDHYKNHISKLLWQSAQNLSGLTQEKCLCRHKAQGGCPPPHGCPTHFSFNQAPSIWGFHQPLQLQRSHCWIPTGQSIKGRWRGGYCRPFRRSAWTGQSHPSSQSIMSTSSHGSLNAKRKWKQFCEPCIDATTKHQKWKSKPGKGNELDMIQWIWVGRGGRDQDRSLKRQISRDQGLRWKVTKSSVWYNIRRESNA